MACFKDGQEISKQAKENKTSLPDFYAVFLSDQEKDAHRQWHNQNVEFGNIWVKKEITADKSRPRVRKEPKKEQAVSVKMEVEPDPKMRTSSAKNDLGLSYKVIIHEMLLFWN